MNIDLKKNEIILSILITLVTLGGVTISWVNSYIETEVISKIDNNLLVKIESLKHDNELLKAALKTQEEKVEELSSRTVTPATLFGGRTKSDIGVELGYLGKHDRDVVNLMLLNYGYSVFQPRIIKSSKEANKGRLKVTITYHLAAKEISQVFEDISRLGMEDDVECVEVVRMASGKKYFTIGSLADNEVCESNYFSTSISKKDYISLEMAKYEEVNSKIGHVHTLGGGKTAAQILKLDEYRKALREFDKKTEEKIKGTQEINRYGK